MSKFALLIAGVIVISGCQAQPCHQERYQSFLKREMEKHHCSEETRSYTGLEFMTYMAKFKCDDRVMWLTPQINPYYTRRSNAYLRPSTED